MVFETANFQGRNDADQECCILAVRQPLDKAPLPASIGGFG
jgi:hypothetical protein